MTIDQGEELPSVRRLASHRLAVLHQRLRHPPDRRIPGVLQTQLRIAEPLPLHAVDLGQHRNLALLHRTVFFVRERKFVQRLRIQVFHDKAIRAEIPVREVGGNDLRNRQIRMCMDLLVPVHFRVHHPLLIVKDRCALLRRHLQHINLIRSLHPEGRVELPVAQGRDLRDARDPVPCKEGADLLIRRLIFCLADRHSAPPLASASSSHQRIFILLYRAYVCAPSLPNS